MGDAGKYRFGTQVIHAAQATEEWYGATIPPLVQSAAYVHETAESLSDSFAGKKKEHIYSRLTNPTNAILEEKLTILENGKGSIVMSSGMAAVSNACMALLRAGDEFVACGSLFMSTYLLFANVFKKYGISAKFVQSTTLPEIEAEITDKTRFVYLETIGNPGLEIPDIKAVSELAHKHGLPLLVDNTLATPYLCQPIESGADIVIHSTTKYLSGHGNATGGAVIDSGNFDWDNNRFPDFQPFIEKNGALAFLDKVWREHHINFGTTQAPFHSFLTLTGLNTLSVRMERHLENAMAVAEFLKQRPEVGWVNYPGLEGHPSRQIADLQFNRKGYGAMVTFGLKDQAVCFKLINNLNLIYHLANLGDCKSLIIHPSSTQYVSFDENDKMALGIRPELLRLSVGIEDIDDIFADLDQALIKSV